MLLDASETPSATRFTLLHSSRVPSELPPPELLQPLVQYAESHPERLKLSFYVDMKDGSNAGAVALSDIQERRIQKADVYRTIYNSHQSAWWHKLLRVASVKPTEATSKKILFLVCGPEP